MTVSRNATPRNTTPRCRAILGDAVADAEPKAVPETWASIPAFGLFTSLFGGNAALAASGGVGAGGGAGVPSDAGAFEVGRRGGEGWGGEGWDGMGWGGMEWGGEGWDGEGRAEGREGKGRRG